MKTDQIMEYACDNLCKYPSEYKDSDDLWNEQCDHCKLRELLEQKNTIKSYEGTIRKLVDSIEELSKENESLGKDLTSAVEMLKKKRKQKWHPVTERLPKEDETVLTWGKENQCILLDWMHDNKWCCFGGADYWMPLPEPPEKESES